MTGRYNFVYRGWGPIEPYDDVLPRELRKQGVFSHLLTDHDHYFELGGEELPYGFPNVGIFSAARSTTRGCRSSMRWRCPRAR